MNKKIDNYLIFLNEISLDPKTVASYIGSETKLAAKWTVIFTPLIWTTWRALNAALSQAVRKCGTFARNTAGRKACISREKIKVYQKKIQLLKSSMGNCKDQSCKERVQLEIKKLENSLFREEVKLKGTLNIREAIFLPLVGAIAIGTAFDSALRMSWRSALALYSSASRKCGIYKTGPERELCMSKIKLEALTKQEAVINQLKTACSRAKNPQECLMKVEVGHEKTIRKIQMLKDLMLSSQNEINLKNQEKEQARREKEERKRNKNKL